MAKILVTHIDPDIDAIAGIWLIKRFFPGWQETDYYFVPRGKTFRNAPPDDDPQIIHVDTGLGNFDHHQTKKHISSAELVFKHLLKIQKLSSANKIILKRLVKVITEIDMAQDIAWEDANNDRYGFMLHNFLYGLKFSGDNAGDKKVDFTLSLLDSIFFVLKNKIRAEQELKKGKVFKTQWGRAIALESGISDVLSVGEKLGYVLVVRKTPKDGHLKIYGRWDKKINLTKAFKQFKKLDPGATWYLHPTKCLLLNGSRTDPQMVPTKLSLAQVIEILQKA